MSEGIGRGNHPGSHIDESEKAIDAQTLLERRISAHERSIASGDGDPNRHAFQLEQLQKRLAELKQHQPKWGLEAAEGLQRLNERFEDRPEDMAVGQLDLPERVTLKLESYNVIWFTRRKADDPPQLLDWTPLMLIEAVGVDGASRIAAKLDALGLRLRTANDGEKTKLPPRTGPRYDPEDRGKASPAFISAGDRPTRKGASERRRVLLLALARGCSERQANIVAGLSATAHFASGNLKAVLKKHFARGDTPRQIAELLGFEPKANDSRLVVGYLSSLKNELVDKPELS